MTRPLSALLAVALPVAVVAAGLSTLEAVRTADDLTQEQNVGSVLNGRQVRRPLLDAIDATLERTDPEVVLLGNSIANTDFVASAFADETGTDPRRIARLSVPNTMSAHWYAILKNRVYAHRHAPRLVLVVSDLQSLLAVTPRSEASHVALTLQLGPDEPVIDGKLGRRWWALERVRENRTVFRDRLMNATRNRVVDLLVYGSLAPRDPRPTDLALARVFAEDRLDHRLHKRVIPIFDVTSPFAVTFAEDELAPVDQGFVPDLLGLVGGHGGTLAFVRPPMSPRLPQGYGDVVPDALAASVPPAFAAAGHVYLDLRAVPMAASHFQNLDHMNEEGGRRFTWIMADALREAGADPRPPVPGVDLLQSFVLVDGVLRPRPVPATFDRPPPNVPGANQEIGDGRGPSGWFATRPLAFLADVATLPVTPHGARCSPVRVVETDEAAGSTLLQPANVTCEELFKLGHGRTCHTADRVYFTAPDGTDPWDNGRTYTLALDPERACAESRWTYPRDAVELSAPDGGVDTVVSTLVLRAADIGSTGRGGPEVLTAEVLGPDGAVRGRAEVQVAALAAGARVPFEPAPAEGLRVRLANPSDHFLLWQAVALRP